MSDPRDIAMTELVRQLAERDRRGLAFAVRATGELKRETPPAAEWELRALLRQAIELLTEPA